MCVPRQRQSPRGARRAGTPQPGAVGAGQPRARATGARVDPAARTQRLVECSSDPYAYVGGGPVGDADLQAFAERCQSEGQLFFGGGGQGISGLSQLEDGTLFVVGTFQRKLAGELRCGLDTQSDHCDTLDAAHTTEELCVGAGGNWVHVQGYCSDPTYLDQYACETAAAVWTYGAGYASYQASGTSCSSPPSGFTRGYTECAAPGQQQPGTANLMQQVTGLAYLVPNTDGGLSELRLLSDPSEEVEHYWALEGAAGHELYYSVYSAGQYNLNLARAVDAAGGTIQIERRPILVEHEVYNLQRDPANPSRVLFDALQFATNTYLFGSADTTLATPEEIQASVETVQGVSGKVETLIVLPNL